MIEWCGNPNCILYNHSGVGVLRKYLCQILLFTLPLTLPLTFPVKSVTSLFTSEFTPLSTSVHLDALNLKESFKWKLLSTI